MKLNTGNANTEIILYQEWSTTKVGVDLEYTCTRVEKKLMLLVLLLCCLLLPQQVNQAIVDNYRIISNIGAPKKNSSAGGHLIIETINHIGVQKAPKLGWHLGVRLERNWIDMYKT